MQVHPPNVLGARWWCEVAGEDEVAPIIHLREEDLAVNAPPGRRVARVHDRLDFTGGSFLDVGASETGDDNRLWGEALDRTLLACYVGNEGDIASGPYQTRDECIARIERTLDAAIVPLLWRRPTLSIGRERSI